MRWRPGRRAGDRGVQPARRRALNRAQDPRPRWSPRSSPPCSVGLRGRGDREQTQELLSSSYRDPVDPQRAALQHLPLVQLRPASTRPASRCASSAARSTSPASRTCSTGSAPASRRSRRATRQMPWVVTCRARVLAVARSSLRTCTHSSRLAATWTTRSTVPRTGSRCRRRSSTGRRRARRRWCPRAARTRGAGAVLGQLAAGQHPDEHPLAAGVGLPVGGGADGQGRVRRVGVGRLPAVGRGVAVPVARARSR